MLFGGLVAIFYSAWRRLFRFLKRDMPSVRDAHRATERTRACAPIPAKVIAVLVPAVPRRDVRGLTPISVNSRHSLHSGAPVPECNDLSQFRDDTGEPSVPV